MTVLPGDILRVVLDYALANSSAVQNVFWFEVNGVGAYDDAEVLSDISAWLTTEWGDLWAAGASVEASIDRVDIDVINPDGTVHHNVGNAELNIPGDLSGETVTSGMSGLLTAYTSFPRSRGSKYVPGLARDGVADNKLQSALMAALADLAVAYVTAHAGTVSSAEYLPGVLSRATADWKHFNGSFLLTDVPKDQARRQLNRGA